MAAVTTKPSLTIKRRFKAPPAKVCAAWSDPEKMKQHRARQRPEGRRRMRPARGGRYHIKMIMAHDEHDVSGVSREIAPDEKLVFTWAWKSTPERESLVTVSFKPDGDGTLMTLHREPFFDEAARDRHNAG